MEESSSRTEAQSSSTLGCGPSGSWSGTLSALRGCSVLHSASCPGRRGGWGAGERSCRGRPGGCHIHRQNFYRPQSPALWGGSHISAASWWWVKCGGYRGGLRAQQTERLPTPRAGRTLGRVCFSCSHVPGPVRPTVLPAVTSSLLTVTV